MKLRPKLCIASSMPQQRIGSTARTLSSTDTDRNPRQTGCPQLVASYDTQEDTLGLFYIPGPTGGCSASEMFVHHNVQSFPECVRTVSYSLLCRLCTTDNAFVKIYLNSIHWKKSKLLAIWNNNIYVRRDHK